MAHRTITRLDLTDSICREVGLSRNQSAELLESIITSMSEAMVAGEDVKISSFGTFKLRDKTARVGRNPKTGEEVTIKPRRVISFRPSHLMRNRAATGPKHRPVSRIAGFGANAKSDT